MAETGDWTIDPETGRSNSSPLYRSLVGEVERLIRSEAHALISGRANMAAGLIMAQLAHIHHLAPAATALATLREEIQARRTALREVALDLDEEGKDAREPFARENELGKVLDLMARMEAGQ